MKKNLQKKFMVKRPAMPACLTYPGGRCGGMNVVSHPAIDKKAAFGSLVRFPPSRVLSRPCYDASEAI